MPRDIANRMIVLNDISPKDYQTSLTAMKLIKPTYGTDYYIHKTWKIVATYVTNIVSGFTRNLLKLQLNNPLTNNLKNK